MLIDLFLNFVDQITSCSNQEDGVLYLIASYLAGPDNPAGFDSALADVEAQCRAIF